LGKKLEKKIWVESKELKEDLIFLGNEIKSKNRIESQQQHN
jgi:hypothetical protein